VQFPLLHSSLHFQLRPFSVLYTTAADGTDHADVTEYARTGSTGKRKCITDDFFGWLDVDSLFGCTATVASPPGDAFMPLPRYAFSCFPSPGGEGRRGEVRPLRNTALSTYFRSQLKTGQLPFFLFHGTVPTDKLFGKFTSRPLAPLPRNTVSVPEIS